MRRIIIALIAILPNVAFAQDRTPTPRPRIGGPVGEVLDKIDAQHAANQTASGGVASSPLDKPFQDLANFIGEDIDAAISLATEMPSLQDGNGQKCLMSLKVFGEVVKKHPAPLTFKIANDLEAFRLKQMAINRLCQEPACTVVFADITQTITAASAIPLPIPSLHDLCAKVPQIAVAAPVAASTPAATQAPATTPANP